MAAMTLADLIAASRHDAASLTTPVTEDWLQGRTCYGGLSAALAYRAALSVAGEAPPLRSAQIAFVGPMAGDCHFRGRLLRRGRNTAFVQATGSCADAVGLSALFLFSTDRPSTALWPKGAEPPSPPIDGKSWPAMGRGFHQHFEILEIPRPAEDKAAGTPEIKAWVRLKDRQGLDVMTELIAIADMLPPPALRLMASHAPISSMTWQIDLLTSAPQTENGWWRLESRATHARDGTSSQIMGVWNSRGEAIANGLQSVALFG